MEVNYFDVSLRSKKEYAKLMEPVCRTYGLTRNELDVLLFLYNNPGLDRAADIVSRRGIAKSHVSLSVSTLEGKGLLQKLEDPEDRRTIHLKLTEPAQHMADTARQAQRNFFGRIFSGLTPAEMALFREITEKIARNIESLENS